MLKLNVAPDVNLNILPLKHKLLLKYCHLPTSIHTVYGLRVDTTLVRATGALPQIRRLVMQRYSLAPTNRLLPVGDYDIAIDHMAVCSTTAQRIVNNRIQ